MSQIICVEIEPSDAFVSNGAKNRLKRDIKKNISIDSENINRITEKVGNASFIRKHGGPNHIFIEDKFHNLSKLFSKIMIFIHTGKTN